MTGSSLAAVAALALMLGAMRVAAAPAPPTPPPTPTVPPATTTAMAGSTGAEPQVLLGPIRREQVEAAVPAWVQAGVASKIDRDAAKALTAVAPGAEVTVLLGTWCSDSRREISRLWRAFDEVGADAGGGPGSGLPFTLHYIGVDETKQQPAAAVAAAGLLYVPTLIVRRDGREVGRIVESSPHGVEVDLLALLDGKATGLLSASANVRAEAAAGSPSPPPHQP